MIQHVDHVATFDCPEPRSFHSKLAFVFELSTGNLQKCKLLQRETLNSISNKSVQFRVQTWLRQIDNASIVVDSLAVMVLYSVQVRATCESSSL